MFESAAINLGLSYAQLGVAQIPVGREVISPEEAALVFSGPQFLVALVAGVVMAFAFQLLLTNFSVAFGISSLGGRQSDYSNESESLGGTIRKIETAVGLWTLVTVSIALFIACFLAVKLSLVNSTVLGAITGIVIWSTYFSLLVWVGSTAVGSLIGSVVSTATSGFQGIMGTTAAALGVNAAKDQAVSTAEAITAAVRRELTSGLDSNTIRETLQSSLGNLQLPNLDLKDIRGQFEQLLSGPELQSLAGSDLLKNIDRQTFVDLISSRTDFSKEEINRIADQLEGAWKQVVGGQQGQQDSQAQLLNFLQSATPEELKSSDVGERLQQLVATGQDKGQSGGLLNRATQLGFSALMATVLERVDLSDLDVEKISAQLSQLKDKATEQVSNLNTQVDGKLPFSTIRADVDNYLLNSYAWHLNRETLKSEFQDIIYDPEADPGIVRQELEQLNQDYFTQKLTQRGDLLPDKITEIAAQLEDIRTEVLSTIPTAPSQAQPQLRSQVENYLRSTGKEELNPEGIQRDFKTLLEDPEAGFEDLSDRLGQFDRETLVQLLKERQDLSEEEANNIISQLESTRDSVLSGAQELQDAAKSKAQEVRGKVETYLRDTNKEELNPEGIKRELQTLLEDPQAGISALQSRLSQFDRDTLVQLLSQRQDLSEEQINQTIDSIEAVRDNILQLSPQKLAGKAKEQYDKTTTTIAEYLRNTNLEELNPEGIKQDLAKLLDDPKEGAVALRERLSQVDRETLVKLLATREDLSEEQVNQLIEQVQESIRSIVKAPRRLAKRTTQQVLDFEANLESYLRNTNKEELNPEGIKRDLQLLLNDPRAGLGNIGDRLKQFDRSSLVALLSQREDISEAEANQIADQVESVRNSTVEQLQKVQQSIQSALDGVFDKIRNYLNSLERPELNYEGIQQDFSLLFDDPQAGLEALRGRLGQVDRDTLVAVLSSREDISEADANRIIAQIEGARDSVLQRAERIQQEAQKRLDALKQQAQKQAVETKKAAAGAAWWLFSTALTSLAASAIAGVIAVAGISFSR